MNTFGIERERSAATPSHKVSKVSFPSVEDSCPESDVLFVALCSTCLFGVQDLKIFSVCSKKKRFCFRATDVRHTIRRSFFDR